MALKAAAIRTLALHFQSATPGAGGDLETFSDATIATVACLANANVSYLPCWKQISMLTTQFLHGDVEEAKIHFQGLKGMIRSRKGVFHLGFQGLAARIVRW